MTEVWAPIPSFPGYAVSNAGRVRGHRGMLSTPATRGGYLPCSLRRGGRKITTTVQRLVAEAFIGPAPSPLHEVNHKDGHKRHNAPDNLEWVTRQENMNHARDVLRVPMGRKRKPRKADARRPIALDLRHSGGEQWTLEPVPGKIAWRAVDSTGQVRDCAALKTLLTRIAAKLPRMVSARRMEN